MQSSYIDSLHDVRKERTGKKKFFLFFLMLSIFLSVFGASSAINNYTAQASGYVCTGEDGLGSFMRPGSWDGGIHSTNFTDKPGKTWTLLEAFGKNVQFVNYQGEGGDGGFLIRKVGDERGASEPSWSTQLPLLKAERGFINCTVSPIMLFVANGIIAIGKFAMTLTNYVVEAAFNSNIVCRNPGEGTFCVDLIGAIGGVPGDGSTGIIGSLYNSIFLPLSILVVVVAGLTIVWQGIVKRQFRQALGSFVWVLLSFMAGVIILVNPQITAKAPTTITSTIAACVIGAFNGENCMESTSAPPITEDNTYTSDNVCISDVPGVSMDEKVKLTIQGLGCSIWRAFILEPYSQGQFGRSFNDLDVTNETVATAISNAGYSPDQFCVNLTSTSPQKGNNILNLDSSNHRVCNLASYQLFLLTNASSGGSGATHNNGASTGETLVSDYSGTGLDTRWYPLILTVSQDSSMWSEWSSSFGALPKLGSAMIILVAGLAGSIVIITISLFALVYLLSSIVLMALIPVFLLIGIHPTKGKRILLGYLEKLISSVLKYLMSAGFLVVTLALYGAVLGNSGGILQTLVFIIALSVALFLYRKEVIELVGRVNMGGEQLSSRFADFVGSKAKGAINTGVGFHRNRLAASLGARRSYGKIEKAPRKKPKDMSEFEYNKLKAEEKALIADRKHTIKTAKADAGRRELIKSSGGFTRKVLAESVRQYQRTSHDNRADLARTISSEDAKIRKLSGDKVNAESRYNHNESVRNEKENDLSRIENEFLKEQRNQRDLNKVEDRNLEKIGNVDLAEFQHITRDLNDLKVAKSLAENEYGAESPQALAVDAKIELLEKQREEIVDRAPNLNGLLVELDTLMKKSLLDRTELSDTYNRNKELEEDRPNKLMNIADQYKHAKDEYNKALTRENDAKQELDDIELDIKIATGRRELLNDAYINLKPGDILKNERLDQLETESDKLAQKITNDFNSRSTLKGLHDNKPTREFIQEQINGNNRVELTGSNDSRNIGGLLADDTRRFDPGNLSGNNRVDDARHGAELPVDDTRRFDPGNLSGNNRVDDARHGAELPADDTRRFDPGNLSGNNRVDDARHGAELPVDDTRRFDPGNLSGNNRVDDARHGAELPADDTRRFDPGNLSGNNRVDDARHGAELPVDETRRFDPGNLSGNNRVDDTRHGAELPADDTRRFDPGNLSGNNRVDDTRHGAESPASDTRGNLSGNDNARSVTGDNRMPSIDNYSTTSDPRYQPKPGDKNVYHIGEDSTQTSNSNSNNFNEAIVIDAINDSNKTGNTFDKSAFSFSNNDETVNNSTIHKEDVSNKSSFGFSGVNEAIDNSVDYKENDVSEIKLNNLQNNESTRTFKSEKEFNFDVTENQDNKTPRRRHRRHSE